MKRWLPVLAFTSLAFVACTSRPVVHFGAPPEVDPTTDPTIVGAVEEALNEGTEEGEEAARTGLAVGRAAGIVAAAVGGPKEESVQDIADRYRRTRDAVTIASATVGATRGAVKGARRGYGFDQQFLKLRQIDGLTVVRPYPDEILVEIPENASDETVAAIGNVLVGSERTLHVQARGELARAFRDTLVEQGVDGEFFDAFRNDELKAGLVLRIRY